MIKLFLLNYPFFLQKSIFLFCLLLSLFLSGESLTASPGKRKKASTYPFSNTIDPNNIRIARDAWGTPHIFAETDPEVAYGLAWANAEDAFADMQLSLLAGKGMLGRVKGVEGAKADFFRHALNVAETVERRFPTDVSPSFLRYLEGYCMGVNKYAETHPKEVLLKDAFPIIPQDILQAFTIAFAFLSGVGEAVAAATSGDLTALESHQTFGSNAFALNNTRTKDGSTYLCTNPHFAVEGPFSFYEAHLHSNEGLNVTGALFQGCPAVCLGSNADLGWGMTFNHFDRVDMYELSMHPTQSLWYEFDGKWCQLETRPVTLKVKVAKFFTIPVKKTSYWSVYGPTFKADNGKFYAVRSLSFDNIKASEQYYRMNKAHNLAEFKDALRIQGVSIFNIIYADKDNNLLYLSSGLMPKRDTSFNWQTVVPGNTSKTLWHEQYSIEEQPHVENPSCGYIFNTNNTAFNATCAEENDDPKRLPKYIDSRPGNNNRARRFMELIAEHDQFSFEEFKKLKFDRKYPKSSHFLQTLQPLYELRPEKYPDIADAIKLMQQWNKDAHPDSIAPVWWMLALKDVFAKKHYVTDEPFIFGIEVDEALLVESIRYAQTYLKKHFGKTNVRLTDFLRHFEDGKDYPTQGFPDVLMATYGEPHKGGKFKINFGDTYIHFAKFTPKGCQYIESLLPFSRTNKQKKYINQLDMYNRLETKVMPLDPQIVLRDAVKIYCPMINKEDRLAKNEKYTQ